MFGALAKALKALAWGYAISKGPTAMAKRYARGKAHKATRRATRKAGL